MRLLVPLTFSTAHLPRIDTIDTAFAPHDRRRSSPVTRTTRLLSGNIFLTHGNVTYHVIPAWSVTQSRRAALRMRSSNLALCAHLAATLTPQQPSMHRAFFPTTTSIHSFSPIHAKRTSPVHLTAVAREAAMEEPIGLDAARIADAMTSFVS